MTFGDSLLVAGRVLLAVVFALAGLTKLLDRAGARRSFAEFGLPPPLASPAGVILPAIELALAAALLPVSSAAYGAAGALALLAVFTAAIAASLARGRAPDCHCFGQLHSEPVGARVLVRNGLLAIVALFVAAGSWNASGPSLIGWLAPLTAFERTIALGFIAIAPLTLAQVFVLSRLVRQNRSILEQLAAQPAGSGRPTGKSVGMAAPAFALPNLHGESIALDDLRARRKPVVLLFSDPNCGPCASLVPEIGAWQRDHANQFTVAVITRGTVEANLPKTEGLGIDHVLIQTDREVAELYGVWGTPTAVMVRADGTIGSGLAQAEAEIRQLIGTLAGDPVKPAEPPAATPPESPVPPTSLPIPASADVELTPLLPADLMLNGRERPPLLIAHVPHDARPVKATCVEDEMLPDGSLVLYNGCRKQVLTLNATAALVWECCDGEHDTGAMIAEVREVFPAAAGAERDVREVLETLAQAGMISDPSITAVSAAPAAAS